MANNFIPIPETQKNLLGNQKCNFSLYSPRMTYWKKVKNKEKNKEEISTEESAVEKLLEKSKSSFKYVTDGLKLKHKQQDEYIESLRKSGVQTLTIKTKTASPFITGLGSGHPTETGMILDRNLGVPYIPASSIKGVLRLAHAVNIANGRAEVPDSELEKYFGTTDTKLEKQYRGQLVFLDAYPAGNVELKVDIMNPHFGKYYSGENKEFPQIAKMPVETETPVPIKFLAVPEGTEFVFRCAFIPLKTEEKCEENEINAMFDTAFDKIGFGGKTSIGYGRFLRSLATVEKDSGSSVTSAKVSITADLLPAGEYEAVINDIDKSRNTVEFKVNNKFDCLYQGNKKKDIEGLKKKDNVKVKTNGEKDKKTGRKYIVTEIIK